MKWLVVSFLVINTLPWITSGVHKKVKILVPTQVKHIHHTKVVKVPEYHHYFHDRYVPHRKAQHYPPSGSGGDYVDTPHNDYYHMKTNEPMYFDDQPQQPQIQQHQQHYHQAASSQMMYNDEFDYFPEQRTNDFHERQQTPALPQKTYQLTQNSYAREQYIQPKIYPDKNTIKKQPNTIKNQKNNYNINANHQQKNRKSTIASNHQRNFTKSRRKNSAYEPQHFYHRLVIK